MVMAAGKKSRSSFSSEHGQAAAPAADDPAKGAAGVAVDEGTPCGLMS
jgi:hypothetical protein